MTRFEARVQELVRQLDAEDSFRYLLARIELHSHRRGKTADELKQ